MMEDRALLDGYRSGDRAALGQVFDTYAPRVAAWSTRGFGFSSAGQRQRFDGFRSAGDVHDTIHDVFRRAFEDKARTAYSGLRPFEGYLFVITRNVVMRRLGMRSVESITPEDLDRMPSSDHSPEEALARKEEQARVQTFLATLTEDERRFADLRFVERCSQAGVAAKLGLTRKKVRRIETGIRTALARHLLKSRGTMEITEAAHEGSR